MCYPVKLLEVEKFNTKETILIKRYLLVRIETMKNARNNVSSKKIIYDRIDKKQGRGQGCLLILDIQKKTIQTGGRKGERFTIPYAQSWILSSRTHILQIIGCSKEKKGKPME